MAKNVNYDRRKSAKPPLFSSCRLVLSVISCLGFTCLYSLRFNMTVALNCMVDLKMDIKIDGDGLDNTHTFRPQCDKKLQGQSVDMLMNTSAISDDPQKVTSGELKWPKPVRTILRESFTWGYWIAQLPSGLLAESYGGKRLVGWAVLGSAVLTFLIPVTASNNYSFVFILRILIGIIQGASFPAMHVLWSRWAPPSERQKLTSLCYSGSVLGMLFTFPFVTMMCDANKIDGWKYSMHITAAVSLLWYLAWDYYVYDTPEVHPRISASEKQYISNSLKKIVNMSLEERHETPWKAIMSSSAFWAYAVCLIIQTSLMFAQATYMGTYFTKILYFDWLEAGYYTALLNAFLFVSWNIAGATYDKFASKPNCSATVIRKTGNSIGFFIPALAFIILGFLDCRRSKLVVAILTLNKAFLGARLGAGFFNVISEMAPQHTGVLYGFANTLAIFISIMCLRVTETLRENRSGWQIEYLAMSAACIISTIVFLLYGSADIQEWAVMPDDEGKESLKPDLSNVVTVEPEPSEQKAHVSDQKEDQESSLHPR